MIRINDIHKTYNTLEVLKGVSGEFKKGEILSIVGPSGAGKTTLLQVVGTLLRPDSGEIWFNDILLNRLKEKELARFRNRNIGFVFQFHQLLPEFNALENVCIPAFIAGNDRSQTEYRAKEILDFLGLQQRLDHKPAELSGGEQQRVAVARALINDPEIILADEPSGNLDTKNKNELHQLFFQLRNEFNQTFIIVTHDTELADMSDRKLTIVDGKFVQ
jgi:lipoprotein-releasing system ATP-binding protein